ncbi:HD family phosphohydrolase [Caldisericum exile]|nr:HDIG domain-containing metalloprotein [Caldisericum exile]
MKIVVNKPAPQDIVVPATISYIDEAKTEEAIANAKNSVKPLYRYDSNVEIEVQSNIANFINSILSIKEDSTITNNKKLELIKERCNDDPEISNILMEIKTDRLNVLKNFLTNELNSLYKKGIRDSEVSDAIKSIQRDAESLGLTGNDEVLALWISQKFVKPNFVFDAEATNKAIQDAIKNVKPVQVVLQEGTKIIEKGHIVTEDDIKMLQKIGIYKAFNYATVGLLFFLSLIESALAFSIIDEKKKKFQKILEYFALLTLVLLSSYFLGNVSIYLIPVLLFLIVMNEFFSFKDVLISIIIFILLLLPFLTQPLLFLILFSAISVPIVYYINMTKKISSYFISGIIGGISVTFTVFFVNKNFYLPNQLSFSNSFYSFLNFAFSPIIAIAVVYIFEHIFNEATLLRLLELNDLNTPLLKEMSIKAPGTFAHSLFVANISSQAAEAINANSILTRVGALYHDIGKLLYPFYFTENQADVPNIHNTIAPSLSKVIILNHVKDGIELAKRYRLPDDIIHFIETHHGKSVMMYFYLKAKESDTNVSMEDFRYPGPLPDTKETVIVSLADAVEAASKSLDKEDIDYRKIEELVNRLIDDRIKQGELSNAEITFSELEKVKVSFVKSLLSIYHKRERYPNGK